MHRRSIGNLGLAVLVIAAAALACARANPDGPDELRIFRPENRQAFETELRAALPDLDNETHEVTVTTFERNAVNVQLDYRGGFPAEPVIAAEAKQVGQAALRVLTAKGYDAQDKWLALFVYAREHLSSTDGTRFARELGKARYDRDTNTLNFEPYRPPIRTRR
jgi:hypothetical protein